MIKIVIVGGGWSGCAAALSSLKLGAKVTLIERTDMLLGTGLVGGIMRNNGRFTAHEEMIAMGGGELLEICDNNSRHTNVEFPGHKHANLYDISLVPGKVLEYITNAGVEVVLSSRINQLKMENNKIIYIEDQDGTHYTADVFIDATGTAGPPSNCMKHGNGCVMCILRCPSFGGRVSLTGLAGVKEYISLRQDGSSGAMSGSCKLCKESLSKEIQSMLNLNGAAVIPVPEELKTDILGIKACQQYALKDFKENIILLDTGHAKMMSPYIDLEKLRKIPGFHYARYEDPYAGGIGNSMRFFAMAPRDNYLKVPDVENLFCCGEKAGPMVGHTEAIVTGTLAGYNSVKSALGKDLLMIPVLLAAGDFISFVKQEMDSGEGLKNKYTFSGSVYFERMKSQGLYTTDVSSIKERVRDCNMENIFNSKK